MLDISQVVQANEVATEIKEWIESEKPKKSKSPSITVVIQNDNVRLNIGWSTVWDSNDLKKAKRSTDYITADECLGMYARQEMFDRTY